MIVIFPETTLLSGGAVVQYHIGAISLFTKYYQFPCDLPSLLSPRRLAASSITNVNHHFLIMPSLSRDTSAAKKRGKVILLSKKNVGHCGSLTASFEMRKKSLLLSLSSQTPTITITLPATAKHRVRD